MVVPTPAPQCSTSSCSNIACAASWKKMWSSNNFNFQESCYHLPIPDWSKLVQPFHCSQMTALQTRQWATEGLAWGTRQIYCELKRRCCRKSGRRYLDEERSTHKYNSEDNNKQQTYHAEIKTSNRPLFKKTKQTKTKKKCNHTL